MPNHGFWGPERLRPSLHSQPHQLWLLTATREPDGSCWATHSSVSRQALSHCYAYDCTPPLDTAIPTVSFMIETSVYPGPPLNCFRSPFSWVHAPCTSLYGILLLSVCLRLWTWGEKGCAWHIIITSPTYWDTVVASTDPSAFMELPV